MCGVEINDTKHRLFIPVTEFTELAVLCCIDLELHIALL